MNALPGATYSSPVVLDGRQRRRQRRDESSECRHKRAKADVICIALDGDDEQTTQAMDDAALAAKLQEGEWDDPMDVEPVEDKEVEDDKKMAPSQQVLSQGSDADIAARLQQEEWEHRTKSVAEAQARKRTEEQSMASSRDGQAWLFVNQVLRLKQKIALSGVETVAVDDMVFLAKQLLECQTDFQSSGRDARVTLAYHYTKDSNMDSIRYDGLMTWSDRRQRDSSARSRGTYFGIGVYTATNPFAFKHFGDVGLLVAVLLGTTKRVDSDGGGRILGGKSAVRGVNTAIGNKLHPNPTSDIADETKFYDELVLQQSRQCLPLLRFDTALVSTLQGSDSVWTYHEELQKVLDTFFNAGTKTKIERIFPPVGGVQTFFPQPVHSSRVSMSAHHQVNSNASATTAAAFTNPLFPQTSSAGVIAFPPAASQPFPVFSRQQAAVSFPKSVVHSTPTWVIAPNFLPAANFEPVQSEVLTYKAPATLSDSKPSDAFEACAKAAGCEQDCAICMDSLCDSGVKVVRLKACRHEYHRKCIKKSLKNSSKCPVCRKLVTKPQGHCPSGTMTITTAPYVCSGYEPCNRSIVITYAMPSGIQSSYHSLPGQPYQGTKRTAYLPENDSGRKLLQRLKYAWMQGLTFTIGISLTTGQANATTWASIHHKTIPSGGPHGFPDAGYFINVNKELDSLGVPA